MSAYDYPIEHFQRMVRIAAYLEKIEGQLLRSEYMYEVFGSWWFTFRRGGREYQVLFDGRDGRLSIEGEPVQTKRHGVYITDWSELTGIFARNLSDADFQSAIESVIQQGLAKEDIT